MAARPAYEVWAPWEKPTTLLMGEADGVAPKRAVKLPPCDANGAFCQLPPEAAVKHTCASAAAARAAKGRTNLTMDDGLIPGLLFFVWKRCHTLAEAGAA